jgi:proteic killer suppression protein
MIISFGNSSTEKIWKGEGVKEFRSFEDKAMNKLRLINGASSLDDLKSPPGNRLEKLKGKRKNQYSVRINDQYRICFIWTEQGVHSVEIVDYH